MSDLDFADDITVLFDSTHG